MRREPGLYVVFAIVSVLSGALLYTSSYYIGSPGMWGYHSVPVSLFKAALPGLTVIVALVADRVRNG